MISEGALVENSSQQNELFRNDQLILSRMGEADLPEILPIYYDNPTFFRLLADTPRVPVEYVLSDLRSIPPNFDKRNKFVIGIYRADEAALIGVADFLISYPEPGKGCFGLLLISERYQRAGYGHMAAELVEQWAHQIHGVVQVSIGVEQINTRAIAFWKCCGYQSVGEVFGNRSLEHTHQCEVLEKRIEIA